MVTGFTFFGYQVSEVELENKKHDLLLAVQDTQRGLVAAGDQRSIIEEALVWSAPPHHIWKF